MAKPSTRTGYDEQVTQDCERVLVTLLSGLGPWRDSVFLIGGLTPRYLVPQDAGASPHAGTTDVDIVVAQEILADTDAYSTLEENLQRLGFERAENRNGVKVSWRWKTKVGDTTMILELLTDAPEIMGGKVQPLPTGGSISALNIPHSSMVFEMYETRTVTAERLGENGITTQDVRHADIVSFTCLKAFAFADRGERKDAHDLIYCLENTPAGLDTVATRFGAAREHEKHGAAVAKALAILQRCFCSGDGIEGYRKDGPIAAAKFDNEEETDEAREARALRQRHASDVVERLLRLIG